MDYMDRIVMIVLTFVIGLGVMAAYDYKPMSKRGFELHLGTLDIILINRALMALPDAHARDTRHTLYSQVAGQVTTPEQERAMAEVYDGMAAMQSP
jgi:hypothetical protein